MAISSILNWFKGGSSEPAEKNTPPARERANNPPAADEAPAEQDESGDEREPLGERDDEHGERRERRGRRERGGRRGRGGDDDERAVPFKGTPAALPADGSPFTVVISRPGDIPHEHDIAEAMLDAGLTRFHLRKHDWPVSDIRSWVKSLQKKYYDRLVVHAQPNVVREFKLAGLHLRSNTHPPRTWTEDIPVSCSCHSFRNLCEFAAGAASYATLGPVFASVSKGGYEPQRTPEEYAEVVRQWKAEQGNCPLLALGGLTVENIGRAREMDFDGFAVVGSVWDAEDPVSAFKQLLSGWKG